MRTTTPSPRLTPEQFRERLYRRIRTAIPTRYKLPATEQEARRMLTQCYLGELYKRGSLPVPAQLLPRPEAIPGRPGAGGHFPGQGGGWQGENGCGGGGRVSGGSG
ncbi:hypothetical protein, partial [Alistipes sp.]